jgi:hypothetical protein
VRRKLFESNIHNKSLSKRKIRDKRENCEGEQIRFKICNNNNVVSKNLEIKIK